jgi:addiction module HigA family antidote
MVRIPTHREPTHPEEMLLDEFLNPMGITQRELTDKIHVPYQRVNEIINKRRGITSSIALRLSKLFRVSEAFWMSPQLRWNLRIKRKGNGLVPSIKELILEFINENHE